MCCLWCLWCLGYVHIIARKKVEKKSWKKKRKDMNSARLELTPSNPKSGVVTIWPILMQSDRWVEKGDFRSKTKSCILTQSKKCLFDPNIVDRAIRSAHPVEEIDFFNEMHGSNCSIENVLEAHRISHHPRKHTTTPYTSSDAGLTATAAAAAAAAHSDSAWHILFSARQQRVLSSDGSSACYR